ncbi:MORN repeat-containing protein 3 isoform X1 [Trichosurus vulpecula]|uniref:MORN repeat-containing protein 3 isoform X1 n=2 Tax=Trichosurus vulpecula TaxID=9337 RepID=UPI00186AEAA3|nr:MORN repeat-containing protein 3 isoform X1 [Trichosurus vulpecula]
MPEHLPGSPVPPPTPHSLHHHLERSVRSSTEAKNTMPITKIPKVTQPLWVEWDRKAQKNGLRHEVYAVNGDCYVGEWKDNKKHGRGIQRWKKSGAIYQGEWKFGKRDGYGILSLPDPVNKYKKVYSGWWANGKKAGYGIRYYGPNEYYEGEWKNGLRSGWGRMYYANGDIYEGQWSEGLRDGEGMLRLSNGNRYEGCWQYGMKNGTGRFFHLDHGQLFEGFWVDDVPKCGTMIDFGRDEAPEPTKYPIPEIELLNPDKVLEEAVATFIQEED